MQELIASLELEPHPEGGFYRQIYKSPMTVVECERTRAALTIIHFLLPAGQVSRWHRVTSDEVWTFLRGEPLRLHRFDGSNAREVVLDETNAIQVVRAGEWQAAEPLGAYALVACFVAPGFEFDDFALMPEATAAKLPEQLRRLV